MSFFTDLKNTFSSLLPIIKEDGIIKPESKLAQVSTQARKTGEQIREKVGIPLATKVAPAIPKLTFRIFEDISRVAGGLATGGLKPQKGETVTQVIERQPMIGEVVKKRAEETPIVGKIPFFPAIAGFAAEMLLPPYGTKTPKGVLGYKRILKDGYITTKTGWGNEAVQIVGDIPKEVINKGIALKKAVPDYDVANIGNTITNKAKAKTSGILEDTKGKGVVFSDGKTEITVNKDYLDLALKHSPESNVEFFIKDEVSPLAIKSTKTGNTIGLVMPIKKAKVIPEIPKVKPVVEKPTIEPLAQEARKYKSAEEFVKAQEQIPFSQSFSMTNKLTRGGAESFQPSKTSVFHGTDPLNIERIISSGEIKPKVSQFDQARESVVSLSKNRNIAETQGGQVVFEIKNTKVKTRPAPAGVVKGEGIIKDFEVRSDTPIKLSDIETAHIHIKKGDTLDTAIQDVKQINRFGNTKVVDVDTYRGIKDKLEKAGIKVNILDENLTKSQLTDIWNKANKGEVSAKAVSEATKLSEPIPTPSIVKTQPEGLLPQEGIIPPKVVESALPTSVAPKVSVSQEIKGAIDRFVEAITTSAKPARKELEKAYSAERAKRTGAVAGVFEKAEGQKGYYQALGKLKGELAPKTFEMGQNLVEQDINSLFKAAQLNPALNVYEKLNTQTALTKLLGGIIPTNSELALLEKTYGSKLVEAILSQRTLGDRKSVV